MATFNVSRLTPGRASQVAVEVVGPSCGVHAAVLTETELPPAELAAAHLHFPGYKLYSYASPEASKTRVVVLTRADLEVVQLHHLQVPGLPMVWLRFPQHRLVLGSLYRQWSSGGDRGLPMERQQLSDFSSAVAAATAEFPADDMCVLGDLNLDMAKTADPS